MKNSKFFQFAKLVQRKIYSLLFFVSFAQLIQAQNPHPEWGLGAKFLTQAQYDALPNANWAEIKSYSTVVPTPEGTYGANGVTMLNNPPIGDQQTQGSCVGWATGYTAMSILTYPKFHCWADARRSPNYVYNQIKVSADCGSGSYVVDGVRLLKNQGDCSWNLMPYNNADCATQPNATQTTNAGQNKAVNWAKLTKNDYANIKLALDLGFPVVVGQKVFQSFYDMWISGGIWSSNYGAYYGNHATCIVGYDDRRQQFKVQNQWGTNGGDNGYYWVTYNMVQNNCFDEVYVVYGNNGSTTLDITGASGICLPSTSETYTIANLPCNTTVSWSTNVPQITVSPATGATTTVNTNGYTGTVTLTATITNTSGTIQIIKPISVGSGIAGYFTVNSDPTQNPLGGSKFVTAQRGAYVSFAFKVTSNNATNLRWSCDNMYSLSNQFNFGVTAPQTGYTNLYKTVNLDATTGCGTNRVSTGLNIMSLGWSFKIIPSPNPAKDIINVSLNKILDTAYNSSNALSATKSSNTTGITKMYLYNFNTNILVKQWTYQEMDATHYSLNIAGLKSGYYVLKMERDNKATTTKILVE